MSENKDRALAAPATLLPPERVLHPMVERMLSMNPSVETAEKLMRMQEDWEKSQAKRAFTAALVALKKALPPSIAKTKGADFGTGKAKYTYATLANMYKAVNPILGDFGFAVTCPATTTKDEKGNTIIKVTATLTHHAGHSEVTTMEGPLDDTGGKGRLQQIGSSATYLQRYATISILGLATEDMDDADDQAPPPPGPAPQPARGAAGAPDTGRVDATKNLKAMAFFVDQGRTKEQVETFVGRPISEWTEKDLLKLRGWMQAPGSKAGSGPAPANPKAGTAPTQRPAAAAPPAEDAGPSPLAFYCGGCLFTHDDPAAFDEHLAVTGHKAGEGSGPKKK